MRKTTAVSYEGDEFEVLALRQIAKERGVTVGNLIADAVHKTLHDDLVPLASFFRKRGSSKSQSSDKKVAQ